MQMNTNIILHLHNLLELMQYGKGYIVANTIVKSWTVSPARGTKGQTARVDIITTV